ncbi:MAG: hypothetical protein HY781_03190, partial [Chloroflexi bacterium]|nr:hypothetical protein [Chloroflexota bacterium]
EFDLVLGASQGDIVFGDFIWSRDFENAVVIVNPGENPAEYTWPAKINFYDVNGNLLQSPLSLGGRSAMLLVKNLSILP